MKKPSPESPGCQDCKFWKEETDTEDDARWGFCRRYPPTVIPDDPEQDSGAECVQTWTFIHHWCGEFSPKQ